ncbi:MAG TPA: AlpA family phage regulatory protein [Thermoanaerobaculia bacterium]|nr:AlpA family phage regulatory protein [Thermoanaerobaculia bacterium]
MAETAHGGSHRPGGPTAITPDRILRLPEVLHCIGVSSATLYRWMDAGDFPAPVRLGKNSVGWRLSAVQDFIESRPPATPRLPSGGRTPQDETGLGHPDRRARTFRTGDGPNAGASRRAR